MLTRWKTLRTTARTFYKTYLDNFISHISPVGMFKKAPISQLRAVPKQNPSPSNANSSIPELKRERTSFHTTQNYTKWAAFDFRSKYSDLVRF
jgi:hypothetical protein